MSLVLDWLRRLLRLISSAFSRPSKPSIEQPAVSASLPAPKLVVGGKLELPISKLSQASALDFSAIPFIGPLGDIRRNPILVPRGDRVQFFGDPGFERDREGRWRVNPRWEGRNIKPFDLPYVGVRYIHKDFGPYLQEGLRRAQLACPSWKPAKIGILNVRRMRSPGPSPRPWSAHAWGIAADISEPDGSFKRYSSMPQEWVDAMLSVGLVHGRHFRGYRDDMHFQIYRTI